jgi:CheY-like chemotaxis protein
MLTPDLTKQLQNVNKDEDKILIVDDEYLTRALLRRVLERINIPPAQIIEAEDGYDALAKVRAHWPALILLDLKMPKLNGYAVCQELQQFDGYSPYIILLTITNTFSDMDHLTRLGASEYITKPFSPTELTETLTRIGYGTP